MGKTHEKHPEPGGPFSSDPAKSQGPAIMRCLVKAGRLSERDAQDLLRNALNNGESPDIVVRDRGLVDREELSQFLENHFYVRALDPTGLECEPDALRLIPSHRARAFRVLPIRAGESEIEVAAADPGDLPTLDSLRALTGRRPVPFVMLESELAEAISTQYTKIAPNRKAQQRPAAARPLLKGRDEEGAKQQVRCEVKVDGDGDVTRLVDKIISDACSLGASDIHIEPWADKTTIRLRVDGVRVLRMTLEPAIHRQVVSRLKIMGGMDIAERRAPLDGRARFDWEGKSVDLRISTLPAKHGEKTVVRLLFKDPRLLDLKKIGMPGDLESRFRELVAEPTGMILVVGPTGSGKTTTLYASLGMLDAERFNTVTLEDPIEYEMSNVTQVQVNPKAGLTFLTGLRSILRQDPDVIMIGEMRDTETAEVACRATLTGHKVFSTLHTADAPHSVARLLDMGIPAYLLIASLTGVLAQRLVRRICEHCREDYEADDTEGSLLGLGPGAVLHRGAGCDRCVGTGYMGRTGVFELLIVDEDIRRLILERASGHSIRYAARNAGFVTLAERGKHLVQEGITTVDELERVVLTFESREQFCTKCQRAVSYEFTVCPFCQNPLREKCPRCGTAIEPAWEACPSCGEAVERAGSRQLCEHCMAVLDSTWDSCPYCGGS